MNITSHLTDVSGPRLTNSPNIRIAAQWVLGKMNEWGIANAMLESWGPFGRGWSNEHFDAAMVKPYHLHIDRQSEGVDARNKRRYHWRCHQSPLSRRQADIEKYRGKLRGKFVLANAPREVTPQFQPNAKRYTDEQLQTMSNPPARAEAGQPRGSRRAARRRHSRT